MVSKTDVLTEALAAATAAVVVTILLDRLQVAPRVSKRLRDEPEPIAELEEEVAPRPLWLARMIEAGIATLIFRWTAGASRTAVHGALKAAGALPSPAAAKAAMSSRSWAASVH
jgi:hypothetical protein